jgi:outer membrane protein insertion porin family
MHIAAVLGLTRKILRRVMPKGILLSFFFAVSTACLVLPDAASAQSFQFSTVTVEGNDRVDASTVVSFAGIARGQALTAGDLNDAFQRVTNSGLFETVELVPSGNTLIIRVSEYPTINVINFEGNKRLKNERLSEVIASRSRRVYAPAQAEADAALISEIYQQEGRLAATVTPKIIRRSNNRVDLVFEIAEGKVIEIERISFVGNRTFSDRRLRQVLETKQAGIFRRVVQSDAFVADRLEFDKRRLRDFYQSRGYVDFQVNDAVGEITRERDGFFVTFTIREGQSFKIGKITTVSEIDEVDAAEFNDILKLRSGVTYSPTIVETNISRLENLALSKGLNFVSIEPRITRNDRDLTLDVEFLLTRGPRIFVERIDIEGNTTTLDEVIRREFNASEGDPFNPREIRRAAERIRALGFFSNASVETEQGTAPDQVIVNVDVEEQPTGSLSFGVSFGADSGVGLTLGFSESNFLGRGQNLGVSVTTASSSQAASLSFVEPAFLGRDLSASFSLSHAETDSDNSDFDTTTTALTFGIGFPISENARLGLNYRLEQSEITGVSTSSSEILQAEEALGSLLTSSVGYSYNYDTRTSGLNPNGGVLLRFSQDFAGLGGDLQFIQTNALALIERRFLNDDLTLRAVFQGGAISTIDGVTRVTERFFANSELRGFEGNGIGPRDLDATNEDALGGNLFAVASFEAEFPIGLPEEYSITGGAFLDLGSVWSLDNVNGSGVGDVDDSFNLRAVVGVSVFWDTPVGPLRFNLSKALKKEDADLERNFDLTISSSF